MASAVIYISLSYPYADELSEQLTLILYAFLFFCLIRFLSLGCGKTRTAVDILSRSWGLYFNAGAADYGSSDVYTFTQAVLARPDIYLSQDNTQNTDRIRHLTFGLLYTRLLILEYCLNIAGSRDTFSCQRWMLLQVATPVFEDVFQALFGPISQYFHNHVVPSTIMDIVQERFKNVQKLLNGRTPSFAVHSKFLVILDESQILSRFFPTHFLDSDRETVRPILAPILFAFRHLADASAENSMCVMPCGTGLSSYELTWCGGSASGIKLSDEEFKAGRLSGMVVDFAGWTDVASISTYLDRLEQKLNDEAKARMAYLIPPEAIARLYRDLRGRFRPIISTIEDIINADDPLAWAKYIESREYRLTTADIPQTGVDMRLFDGNLCGELERMFRQVCSDEHSLAYAEFRNVEATLRFAVAAFMTQGGYLAFKGQLPKLVETAFGRIRTIDGEYHTTIDEPFVLKAADNYFRKKDPDYLQFRLDQLARCATEQMRGKEWEFSIPFEMVHLFHHKTVSSRLFRDGKLPHNMFRHEASIVGWPGFMRTTCEEEITMADFLDAHIHNNSERDGELVPPFLYPREHVSGPDIVFVVRFSGSALDSTVDSSSTSSSGSSSSSIICPVFVQVKLCQKLDITDAIKARSTVQPTKIKGHGVEIGQFCQPNGHYISLVVSYPANFCHFFKDRPVMQPHPGGSTEIALTIDDSNIDLFTAEHVKALKFMKRQAGEMEKGADNVRNMEVAAQVKRIKTRKGQARAL